MGAVSPGARKQAPGKRTTPAARYFYFLLTLDGRRKRSTGESRMARGTVKWFNDSKGFGFIEQEGGGEDVFVHHTSIIADGYRSLKEGQAVEFEVTNENKGLRAHNVRVTN
jgi:CspA family cold shock protein